MALVNHVKKEINAKIVYCGPPGSGKGTSLAFIYKRLKPEFRGQFKTMQVRRDKLLFFDFLPPGTETINGYRVRFHIYTVSGPGIDTPTWKVTLKGADGVVLVADSSPGSIDANIDAMTLVRENLQEHGVSVEDIPFVLQINKRDVPSPLPAQELEAMLTPGPGPVLEAVAVKGDGVLGALSAIIRQVVQQLREMPLDELDVSQRRDSEPMTGLIEPEEVATPEAACMPAEDRYPVYPSVAEVAPEEDEERDVSLAGPGERQILAEGPAALSQVRVEEDSLSPAVSLGAPVLDDSGKLQIPLFVAVGGKVSKYSLCVSLTRSNSE